MKTRLGKIWRNFEKEIVSSWSEKQTLKAILPDVSVKNRKVKTTTMQELESKY